MYSENLKNFRLSFFMMGTDAFLHLSKKQKKINQNRSKPIIYKPTTIL